MPTYRYRCQACKQECEIQQKISEAPLTCCPDCSQEAMQRIPPKEVAIQFKGSGFYITDYTNKNDSTPGCGKGSCGCH